MSSTKWIQALLVFLAAGMVFIFFRMKNSKPGDQEKKETIIQLASLKAYDQYQQGRNYWNIRNESSLRKAITYFNKAIELDSGLAVAYAGIADCYAALGYGSYEPPSRTFLKAETAAIHALRLDSNLANAHTSLGYIKFYYYWDWPAAEKEFLKAQQLDPQNELSYTSYTYFLTAMGRFPESWVNIQKALELNPLSSPVNTDKGFFLYYTGHYDEAIKSLQETIGINKKNPLTHLWLGRAYQKKKQYEKAVDEYRQTLGFNENWPVAWAAIGNAYGYSGQHQKARNVLDTLRFLSNDRFVTPYGIALVYASLNEKDKAFEWLDKAFIERSNWLVWLAIDPRWNAIRSDKRFEELLLKMNLKQPSSRE
jgi:tetratricopeptide (TPR) repeat protein